MITSPEADVALREAALQVRAVAGGDVGACGCVELGQNQAGCKVPGADSRACAATVVSRVARFAIQELREGASGALVIQTSRCLRDATDQLQSGSDLTNWTWLSSDSASWLQKRVRLLAIGGLVLDELNRQSSSITDDDIATAAKNYLALFALGSSRMSPDFPGIVQNQDGRAASFESNWPGKPLAGASCPALNSSDFEKLAPAQYVDCLQQHIANLRRKIGDNEKLSQDATALISEGQRQSTCNKDDISCCLAIFPDGQTAKVVADYVFGSGDGVKGETRKTFRQEMAEFCSAAVEAGALPSPDMKPDELTSRDILDIVSNTQPDQPSLSPDERRLALGKLARNLSLQLSGTQLDAYDDAVKKASDAKKLDECQYYTAVNEFRSEYEKLKARGPGYLPQFQNAIASIKSESGRADSLSNYLALVDEMQKFNPADPRYDLCRGNSQK
jgi:hypothetical protein